MKHLVIAEKPSVARDIARVLKCQKKTASYIEGNEYIITWALGHLVTLEDPEGYGNQYKTWSMETLPMMPKEWKLTVIKQTSKQYRAVKEQIYRKDVSNIIIATDAGREGELVARWILEKADNKKPVKRLWISSVTDKAIRDGFAALKPGKDYENLYHAAVSRAKADWLVGINATRALTCKYNAQLSCGRVQTPTLAMIADREDVIRNFKPETYYGLKITSGGLTFTWNDSKSGSARTFQKERIEKVKNQVTGSHISIVKVAKKAKKTYSPALYDLTELQREANAKYGLSAKETLNIMQRLYENHKVLTYPRTDSRYITADMVPTLKERLSACSVGPYSKIAGKLTMQKIHATKAFVDDSKVTDHHAIIPTEQFVQLQNMSNEERKIYDMVVRRFIAVLYPACEYEQTSITAKAEGETFTAKGNVVIQKGWKEAYETAVVEEDEDLAAGSLSYVPKEGAKLVIDKITQTEGKTNPPARYTEGVLISEMEKKGLGTVATRADIIEKLFGSFLMEKKGKEIQITSKGKQLLELVPQDLKKPDLTADWEKKLMAISKGKLVDTQFMSEITGYTKAIIREIQTADGKFRHDNLTRHKCPECGKYMLEVNGKHGKMLVCQDRECGYRETIARKTNARCPVCHKKMEMTGKGEAQRFTCSCGYKEKLSAFQERKKKETGGASKKDVNQYLNKQKKEAQEPINNAFADAFAKLKL